MKRKLLIGITAYVVLLVICLLIVYAFPSVMGLMVRTYIAEEGEVSITDEITGYVVRDEEVYTAAQACTVKKVVKSGTLVSANSQAAELQGEGLPSSDKAFKTVLSELGKNVTPTQDGKVSNSGYIVYTIDGYEKRITPDKIKDIKMSEYKKLNTNNLTDCANGQVAKGDPIYKLVKNSKWRYVFFVDIEDTDNYIEGDTVDITIDDQTEQAVVSEITKGENVSRIVLKCGFYNKTCLKERKIVSSITRCSAKGLLLETDSLCERKGKTGVLVKDKLGNYTFTRVCIKASDGKNCVAYQDLFMDEKGEFVETIGIYDEIVKRPTQKEIKEAA